MAINNCAALVKVYRYVGIQIFISVNCIHTIDYSHVIRYCVMACTASAPAAAAADTP